MKIGLSGLMCCKSGKPVEQITHPKVTNIV